MNPELLRAAEQLWTRGERALKFTTRFGIYPVKEGGRIIEDQYRFIEALPNFESPANQEEVYLAELRRKLTGAVVNLEHWLDGHNYTFGDVVSLYAIDPEDISGLKSWLVENRDQTQEVVDRVQRETEVEDYEYPVRLDLPHDLDQAKGLAVGAINNYHQKLGRLFMEVTPAGSYLREILAVPTTDPRSYFDPNLNTLAIGIPAICYQVPDRTIHIRERELIRLYGHEGMGHGINKAMTDLSELPFFLKKRTHSTDSTVESVGQFYQVVIFDELANSSRTQKALGIDHRFPEIYQEAKDVQKMDDYGLKLLQYSITVLADKSLGDPRDPEVIKRKKEIIGEYALYPGYATNIVEGNLYNFDSEGNLTSGLVRELMYCSQPVTRVLEEMAKKGVCYDTKGRGRIDDLILRGFWSPIGLVENARVTSSNT